MYLSAFVTSTEPYQIIKDLNQSPFNVGTVVEPQDFTSDQVADLVNRHRLTLSVNQHDNLMQLLGGHPFLIRRALYLLANNLLTVEGLLNDAAGDSGPFSDHLRHHLLRLNEKQELVDGMLQVIRHNRCDDERVAFRLQYAGLVIRDSRRAVLPRCQLYAQYFRERLHE
jgi:hypothetical protein